MKKLITPAILMMAFLLFSGFRIEYGRNIVITQPVYEDLYISGGTITINAPVYGDLIVAGGNITINDTIANDIMVAGGTVTINGYVGDDVRCAGGDLRITKNISGDLVIAGGRIEIDRGVTLGGLVLTGGNAIINGDISSKVMGRFGELTLNGNVAGDIDCRGNKLTINGKMNGNAIIAGREITIGNNALFNGQVRYWSRAPVNFKQSVANGKPAYDPELEVHFAKWYFLGSATIIGMLLYLGMALVMIAIIHYLFSGTMKRAAVCFYETTLRSLGLGLLYFIGTPVAIVIILITVIGIPVAMILLAGYIILLLLVTVITSLVLANWINNVYQKNWNSWKLVFAAFGLFILIKLASLTPFIGWIVLILVGCTAFGGILLSINWKRKKPVAIPA